MQLDYKVTAKKIKDIFKMAGAIVNAELKEDKEGKSRGMAIVQFEHAIEAVQAICILTHLKDSLRDLCFIKLVLFTGKLHFIITLISFLLVVNDVFVNTF